LLSFKLLRLMVDGLEAVGIVHENVQCLANNNVSEAFTFGVDHRSREVAVFMKRREFLKQSVFLHAGYGCGIPIVRTSASPSGSELMNPRRRRLCTVSQLRGPAE
jgi:hypothetical protein